MNQYYDKKVAKSIDDNPVHLDRTNLVEVDRNFIEKIIE